MSEVTFTPGPWRRDRESGVRCDVRAANGRKVALCWGLSTSKAAQANAPSYRAECDANARLIAAAPEMYEALEELAAWIEHECGAEPPSDKASAALAKARGEA